MMSEYRPRPIQAFLKKEEAIKKDFQQMSIIERILVGAELSELGMQLRTMVLRAK